MARLAFEEILPESRGGNLTEAIVPIELEAELALESSCSVQ
jgi:hypothetical protein